MKMSKRKILLGFAGVALIAVGCSEDFISETPKGQFFEENYYTNEEQSFSGLVAVYDVLRKNSGGFENMITMMNAGSDDFYAGGGSPSDGAGIHGFDNFTINALNVPRSYFGDYYRGIARANSLILKLPDAQFSNEATRARFMAEARVLRAFYYFQLVNLFGNIPLITEPVNTANAFNIPQTPKEEVYAFIESEIAASLNDLPITLPSAELGRLTQGSAKAILGKTYLYESKWAEAAAQFADVNGTPGTTSMYGYSLVADFASLWSINNKFNSESILEVAHTNLSNAGWGNWGSSSDEGNSVNQMVGPRGFTRPGGSPVPSYISGWSFNPVTEDLYNAMVGDPRFSATILDMPALVAAGQANYAPADQDTGYFLKKFMPLTSESSTGGGNTELNYRQNTYWIRLADTYLMEAEALVHTGNTVRAQALLDAVRARVGLTPIPISLEAVYQERRLELAGEGQRFFDLVRTNRTNLLVPDGFVVGKNEVLPLPFEDISNTLLEQNPGY
ncbi:RagB/SusD family nutrient uptake outer membrane protein [Flavobacterium sp. MAH-1]|uniref:RagB/SusD family nutrient uptake outer membrane protein n=1 Tax=Flavobacterium agri TaxID=2743471 RepID=A0A7Y9C5T2_9FLAO|nr:RagB/SusD family nutrient uptake outer membrane protein [Flavobacterium agri]NUY80720.1 RagB/SusD family nutrient uptake outer membrane protein [Flavobacterium agri]NYA70744.1 RagB/SusD family nutrient uptake outer membrane protein [Flavobacterium agri]